MSYAVRFNWVLQIKVPEGVRIGETYPFSKPGSRIFPIGAPIDLIDPDRNAIAKIKITQFSQDGENTNGFFTVIKVYESPEKDVLTNYWKENE